MTGETAFEGVERSGEGGERRLLELFDNRCTDNFVHFLLPLPVPGRISIFFVERKR